MAGEGFPGRVVGADLAGGDGGGVGAGGVDHLGARAVVEREDEGVSGEVRGGGYGGFKLATDELGEVLRAADGEKADLVFNEGGGFALQEILEQRHERADLVLGAFPVFDGERVEREVADAEFLGGVDDAADGLDSAAVALDAGEPALFGPATVAVHDAGYVGGGGVGGFGHGRSSELGRGRGL